MNMKTVAELMRELEKFPDDARCWAYEGEVTGIVIESKNGTKSGLIHLKGSGTDEETVCFKRKGG
jgi:hypothetical protein